MRFRWRKAYEHQEEKGFRRWMCTELTQLIRGAVTQDTLRQEYSLGEQRGLRISMHHDVA